MRQRLAREFYARDTMTVARELLGQRLTHVLADGRRLSGRIVETEAYLGVEDPACHSYGGRRTPRTEVMFGEPGFSYIYFIYGMYFCFNVITVARDVPEAVLIRAVDTGAEATLANGPGKLCRALHLGRQENALDLCTHPRLWVEPDVCVADIDVIEGPRVGLGERHDAVHWPLRFGIKGHPCLSPPKFPADWA